MVAQVFMVAEKPSICNAIAQALSGGKHETHGRTPPVHTLRGSFRGQQANIKVSSVVGHVFSTDFPSAYQSWDKVIRSRDPDRVPLARFSLSHISRSRDAGGPGDAL